MSPAFDELFASLQRPVFALCLRLSGNRADAEDAFQDVWLAIHGALPRFRGEAQPSTWVYRIALRVALRARSRRRPLDELSPEREQMTSDPRPTAEAQLEGLERDRLVAASVARLPAEHRTVLALFAVDELSHKEIAAILGVPEGTVWSRLHTARKRLVAELGDPSAHAPVQRRAI